MKKFPYCPTRAEIKRIVYLCHQRQSQCRVGQAVGNQFELPKEIDGRIYQNSNFDSVVDILYHHYHRSEYQNELI